MDITRRCDYACRILRAAYRNGDTFISITDVANDEDIPYAFARSIQHDLATVGFIETARGSHGGLKLRVDPSELTVLDVLQTVQGSINVAACTADQDYCDKSEGCVYHSVWQASDKLLSEFYGSITLSDLFNEGSEHPTVKGVLEGTESIMPADSKKSLNPGCKRAQTAQEDAHEPSA